MHSASVTGITTMDIKFNDPNRIVTGGNDKTAVVFNNSTEQIVATLKGHTKKVTQALYHPDEVNYLFSVCSTRSHFTLYHIWTLIQGRSRNSQC